MTANVLTCFSSGLDLRSWRFQCSLFHAVSDAHSLLWASNKCTRRRWTVSWSLCSLCLRGNTGLAWLSGALSSTLQMSPLYFVSCMQIGDKDYKPTDTLPKICIKPRNRIVSPKVKHNWSFIPFFQRCRIRANSVCICVSFARSKSVRNTCKSSQSSWLPLPISFSLSAWIYTIHAFPTQNLSQLRYH